MFNWKIKHKSLATISLIFFLSACQSGRQSKEIYLSASACAKSLQNGQIIKCKVDKDSDGRMSKFIDFSIDLDTSYPGPEVPCVKNLSDSKLYEVERIDQNNIIYLKSGVKLLLAGLRCKNDSDFNKYLATIFLGQSNYKVSYHLTGLKIDDMEYAYIWEVGIEGSVSSTNETAITNQWCEPINQEKHKYYTRYKLLFDYAKNNPN